jgi:NADPH:quinone reductase-like Zn-dependent oxidoreductase
MIRKIWRISGISSAKVRVCTCGLRSVHSTTTAGKIKPVIDSVFSFEDTLEAYKRIMSYRARGKVIIMVDPEAD